MNMIRIFVCDSRMLVVKQSRQQSTFAGFESSNHPKDLTDLSTTISGKGTIMVLSMW